jgi:hypothetical protein
VSDATVGRLKAEAEQLLLNHRGGGHRNMLVDAQQLLDLIAEARQAAAMREAIKSARSRGSGREMVELWDGADPVQAIRNLIQMAGLRQSLEPQFPPGESELINPPRRKRRWF